RDVIWGVKTISYGLEEDLVFINVNCHGRHWSCTFTKAELERKRKSGLIELLAFENDSYSLTIKDIEKENKMKELGKPENGEKKVVLAEEAWKEAMENLETGQEKKEIKEIKIPIKEGDLQDSTVSRLIKEKIEKDSKETVVGRKGCVDEVKTKDPVNMDVIMTKLDELIRLNKKFLERLGNIWKHKRWLEHEILEMKKKENHQNIVESESDEIITNQAIVKDDITEEIEDKIKEIGNLFSDIVLLKMSIK
ncbi:hypothetical protein LCGC14_1097910, partial [marine sediment metagenome]